VTQSISQHAFAVRSESTQHLVHCHLLIFRTRQTSLRHAWSAGVLWRAF